MKIFKKICGVWQLIAAGVAVGVFAVVTGIMAIILEKFSLQTVHGTCLTNASDCSIAYNIIGYGSAALLTMAQFLGIVAITLIGAYIISLLIRQFAGGGKY
jgi:hypothetical protein